MDGVGLQQRLLHQPRDRGLDRQLPSGGVPSMPEHSHVHTRHKTRCRPAMIALVAFGVVCCYMLSYVAISVMLPSVTHALILPGRPACSIKCAHVLIKFCSCLQYTALSLNTSMDFVEQFNFSRSGMVAQGPGAKPDTVYTI